MRVCPHASVIVDPTAISKTTGPFFLMCVNRTPENPLICLIRDRIRIGAKFFLGLRTVRIEIVPILKKCLRKIPDENLGFRGMPE